MSAPFAPAEAGPRIVALCKGYGGLDLGLQSVLGGEVVAYAEIKPAAVALLVDRYPDVPNLGDLTVADWTGVEAEIVTAGWPCQPHSAAGKRLGEEDPRAIWPAVLDVVRVVRPLLFVGENVARTATNGELRRALRSLAAIGYVGAWRCLPASDLGAPHKRDRLCLVAVDASVPHAEADRRVARWARTAGEQRRPGASVGGGPPDEDVSLLPTPTTRNGTGHDPRGPRPSSANGTYGLDLQTVAVKHIPAGSDERLVLLKTPTANLGSNGAAQHPDARRAGGHGPTLDDEAVHLIPAGQLLPTPTARDHKGAGWGDQPGRPLSETIHRLVPDAGLLPTPTVVDMGERKTPAEWDDWTSAMRERHGNGNGHGRSLSIEAKRLDPERLLPTHRVCATRTSRRAATAAHSRSGPSLDQAIEIAHGELPREFESWDELPGSWHPGDDIDDSRGRWGVYAPAVERWEAITGAPAPAPTQPSTKAPHNPQLSPAFVEWMMGVPKGWVTDGAPGLGHNKAGKWTAPGERNAFLSLLGDGVVPQWAAAQVAFLVPIALGEVAELEQPHERDREAEVVVVADMEPTHARLMHLARNARTAGLWSDEVRARFSARKIVVLQNALVREAKDAEDLDTLKALARRAVREGLWCDEVREAFTGLRLAIEAKAQAAA